MIYRSFETASAFAAQLTRVVVVLMAVLCMSSLIYQVFTRYFLGSASSWTEELALFLFTWIVLLAGSLGVREGFHVRLTVILDLFPSKARIWIECLISLAVTGFGVALMISGVDYLVRTMGHVSAAVRYPIEALTLAVPVTGILIILHGIPRLLNPMQSMPTSPPET